MRTFYYSLVFCVIHFVQLYLTKLVIFGKLLGSNCLQRLVFLPKQALGGNHSLQWFHDKGHPLHNNPTGEWHARTTAEEP